MSFQAASSNLRQTIVHSLSSIVLMGLLLAQCASSSQSALPSARISAVAAVGGSGAAGFAHVTAPRPFVFPQDHGPHQEYATEWWYYTGNLDTSAGRHFGFQLTFFRFGLAPKLPERPSDWATANIYMAHFALTDVAGKQFYAFDRFSRGAAGLAGAQAAPYQVWLEDWRAESRGADALPMRLHAAQDAVALDLTLEGGKPAVAQGDRGLSQKSAEAGNASYYYSLTRMPTRGTIRVGGESFEVSGLSWMDREWSTSALAQDIAGWDWFALQLADGRDVMYYQLRETNGAAASFSSGAIIAADGSTRRFGREDVQIDSLGTWQSQRSGGRYPAEWRFQIPSASIDLRITPYLADQELPLATVYWEGTASISGTAGGQPAIGSGYVELTGYAEQQGREDVRVR
jgi:predicted secreted hydrolase